MEYEGDTNSPLEKIKEWYAFKIQRVLARAFSVEYKQRHSSHLLSIRSV